MLVPFLRNSRNMVQILIEAGAPPNLTLPFDEYDGDSLTVSHVAAVTDTEGLGEESAQKFSSCINNVLPGELGQGCI